MDPRRIRILLGPGIAAALLAMLLAAPVAAAECALTAPAAVNVGNPLTIEGAGFPASTSVDIELSIDGTAVDSFTQQSDASGNLSISLTPEDADLGTTRVVATAGSTCTAEVTYVVLAAGETLPPTAEPEGNAGASPTAPRTDASGITDGTKVTNGITAALAIVLLAIGAAGLVSTRSRHNR